MYNHVLYLPLLSKNNYTIRKSCTGRTLSSWSILGFENNGLLPEPIVFSTEEPNIELALMFLLLPLKESIGI